MLAKKRLKQVVTEVLGAEGFLHKGSCWYRAATDAFLVFDLQKSDFDSFYWVNVAIWIRECGEPGEIPPRENHCHIRLRGNSDFDEGFNPAFDLEGSLAPRIKSVSFAN